MVELPCYAVVELPCNVLVILTWLDQVIEVSLNPVFSYLLLRDWAGWRSVVWRRGETYSRFIPNWFWPSWKQLIILTWKDILPESCVATNIGPLVSCFFFMNCAKFQFGKKNPTTTWRRSKNPQENCHDSDPDLWWNKVDLEFYPPACATEKAHKAPPKAQVFHEFCSLGTAWRWGRKVTNKLAPGNTMVASYMLEARTPRICNVYLF